MLQIDNESKDNRISLNIWGRPGIHLGQTHEILYRTNVFVIERTNTCSGITCKRIDKSESQREDHSYHSSYNK